MSLLPPAHLDGGAGGQYQKAINVCHHDYVNGHKWREDCWMRLDINVDGWHKQSASHHSDHHHQLTSCLEPHQPSRRCQSDAVQCLACAVRCWIMILGNWNVPATSLLCHPSHSPLLSLLSPGPVYTLHKSPLKMLVSKIFIANGCRCNFTDSTLQRSFAH